MSRPVDVLAGWYCHTCRRAVEGVDVTHDERHDSRAGGCGNTVGSAPAALDVDAAAKAVLQAWRPGFQWDYISAGMREDCFNMARAALAAIAKATQP